MRSLRRAAALSVCLLALSACKLVKTADEAKIAEASAFNPDKMVQDIWDAKVVPFYEKHSGDFATVSALAATNPDEAGQKFGHKEKQGTAPWTYAAHVSGKIVAEDMRSRAASVEVDVNGDGKGDVKVALGPAVRGTALRDALDFLDFNSFKNQIEWAQFGKSFNTHMNAMVLSKLPREGLTGKTLDAYGAFPLPSSGQLPQFVPAKITIGG